MTTNAPLPAPRSAPIFAGRPRLLDQRADAARKRGASEPTARQMVSCVRAFVLFHRKRHPRELPLAAVGRFLTHVVQTDKDPLVALEAARAALDVLYRHVLGIDVGELPRPRPPRLLDQMSQVLRLRHYSPRTEACYTHWARHFILFHGKRHPQDMGAAEVARFLTHRAVDGRVSASSSSVSDRGTNQRLLPWREWLPERDGGVFSTISMLPACAACHRTGSCPAAAESGTSKHSRRVLRATRLHPSGCYGPSANRGF